MSNFISVCGINCEECDARIATEKDDNNLREQVAKKWRTEYNAQHITAEMINCTGCRIEGVKFGHCENCQIRKCAHEKGFSTCGECSELEKCETVDFVLKNVPNALANLKSIS
jgi:hypothetical protein